MIKVQNKYKIQKFKWKSDKNHLSYRRTAQITSELTLERFYISKQFISKTKRNAVRWQK